MAKDGGCGRIVHIAASLAAGHLGSLRDAIPALTTAAWKTGHHRDPPHRRAAPVNLSPDDVMELAELLQFLGGWLRSDRGNLAGL